MTRIFATGVLAHPLSTLGSVTLRCAYAVAPAATVTGACESGFRPAGTPIWWPDASRNETPGKPVITHADAPLFRNRIS